MSSTSSFVKVPNGRLFYERSGQGPAIVFIHAAIADRRMYGREATAYADQHAVIRYDLRGYGQSEPATTAYSDVDDLRRLLDHLGLEKASLLGSSRGGGIAIDFALAYPAKVDRMVLVAPALGGFQLSGDPEEERVFKETGERYRTAESAWKSGDREGAIEGARKIFASALEGEALELFRTMLRENLDEFFSNRSENLAIPLDPLPAGRLGSIKTPALVLQGQKDAPQMRFIGDRIAVNIPGAKHILVPEADHLINLSQPETFDAAVLPFLS